jgi:aminodeoxyfutalosine deaminase
MRSIELHVHLEGTIRAPTLLEIARRNDVALPASSVEGLGELYRFRDFDHFIEVWILATNALRSAEDFRQVVVYYAAEAASHGAVYIEGIFSPAERVARGVPWDTIFSGYCDGAVEAKEKHGVVVRLTPDIYRGASLEEACDVARWVARSRSVESLGWGSVVSRPPTRPSPTRPRSPSPRTPDSALSPMRERWPDPNPSGARSTRWAPTGSAMVFVPSRTPSWSPS